MVETTTAPALTGAATLGSRRWLSAVAIIAIACVWVVPGSAQGLWQISTIDTQTLRGAFLGFGPLAPLASVALNVMQAVLAPVPATAIVYLNGAVFGVWAGALLNLVGGVVGALACFAIARTMLRPRLTHWLERTGRSSRLHGLTAQAGSGGAPRRDGLTILMLRLVPGVPFDLVSYGAGVSRVGWWPFLWGTTAGSAPHAVVYALLGASLNVPVWVGIAAAAGLGLAIAAARGLTPRLRRVVPRADPTPTQVSATASRQEGRLPVVDTRGWHAQEVSTVTLLNRPDVEGVPATSKMRLARGSRGPDDSGGTNLTSRFVREAPLASNAVWGLRRSREAVGKR